MKKMMCLALVIAACSSNSDGPAGGGGASGGGGAGGPSATPAELCTEIAEALCDRLYSCLSPGQLAAGGFPAAQSDCVAMVEARKHCPTYTAANACTVGTYQSSEATACSEQTASLSCTKVVPGFQLETAVPACGKVCE
jgi:hypothetical protein